MHTPHTQYLFCTAAEAHTPHPTTHTPTPTPTSTRVSTHTRTCFEQMLRPKPVPPLVRGLRISSSVPCVWGGGSECAWGRAGEEKQAAFVGWLAHQQGHVQSSQDRCRGGGGGLAETVSLHLHGSPVATSATWHPAALDLTPRCPGPHTSLPWTSRPAALDLTPRCTYS